jgi:hypothetical protein
LKRENISLWAALRHLDERSRQSVLSFHELKPDWAYEEEVIGLDGISGVFGLTVENEFRNCEYAWRLTTITAYRCCVRRAG